VHTSLAARAMARTILDAPPPYSVIDLRDNATRRTGALIGGKSIGASR
jgi:hypothetical protein